MPNYPQSNIIRHLFNQGQPIAVSKGEVIIGNDPEPDGVYFIESGYIKVYSISNDGDQYLHIIYGNGEIFPITWAYLVREAREIYYESISDCTLWRISRYWFTRFIKSNAEVSYALSMQLAWQFQIYSDRIDNLEHKKASDRIVYRLLFLAKRFGVRKGQTIVIDAPITHDLFASSINLVRESVSREIEKLEKQNVIKRINSHIVITDLEALVHKIDMPIDTGVWHLH